jgi:hypothetical protein
MVELREIVTAADRERVLGLRLGPGQERYLNSIEDIFLEADEEQRAMPRSWAVHDATTGQSTRSTRGRGYGAATIDALVRYSLDAPVRTSSTRAAATEKGRRDPSTCGMASRTRDASWTARTCWRSTCVDSPGSRPVYGAFPPSR